MLHIIKIAELRSATNMQRVESRVNRESAIRKSIEIYATKIYFVRLSGTGKRTFQVQLKKSNELNQKLQRKLHETEYNKDMH